MPDTTDAEAPAESNSKAEETAPTPYQVFFSKVQRGFSARMRAGGFWQLASGEWVRATDPRAVAEQQAK